MKSILFEVGSTCIGVAERVILRLAVGQEDHPVVAADVEVPVDPASQKSYDPNHLFVDNAEVLPSKYCFCEYQHGPQLRTQPTLSPSPFTWRNMSAGVTPCVGLV